MRPSIQVSLFAALGVCAWATATALPRFASRTGMKCQSCHVNPSGGEMRQTMGVQYGREQLPVPEWSKDYQTEDFSNLLTNLLGVGADFRTLYFVQHRDTTTNNAFFEMQGDVYLDFHVAKKVSMFIRKGLYSGLGYSDFEIYGLLALLPASGHIKIGRFIPNFGIKMDDHTVFTRTYTGFSQEVTRPELTGLEVGVAPGPFTIVGGFYNAQDDFGAATGSKKAFLARAEGMFKLTESMNLGLGGNIFAKQTGLLATKSLAGDFISVPYDNLTLGGGFGSFSYKDLTIFGEVDLIKTKLAGVTTTGVVSYVEADYPVIEGLDLKVAYDFYDPDKDLKTGSIGRYSLGFECFPLPGVEVRPVYRFVRNQPTDLHNDEFHLIFHFYI